jgi:hypothetical protein
MRASEFLTEGDGKMHDHHSQATQGIMRVRDIGGYDRTYHINRMMMAMSMADGKSQDAVDMDSASFVEKYNTVHPYTEEEYNMFVSATKTIPTDQKTVVPYSKSQEPEDTNKQSLVKPFKGYKRK